ncbi:hypothetical protein [Catenuloplanes japonicus]|uniref:hypothetical protein n=1 Tax=Catenuloplanes japonicus TaxID=33876 RepID=UPI0005257556|nr:hypothetical protein [Catenuloplanes japonicus]
MPVVNPDKGAAKVQLVPPNPYGYLLVTAEVDPGSVTTDVDAAERVAIPADIPSASAARAALHRALDRPAGVLAALPDVRSVSVFEAVLFAPGSLDRFPARGSAGRPARYDTLVMVETGSPESAAAVNTTPAFAELMATVTGAATYTDALPVTNAKKIDDVDRDRSGVFLFNFFFADDPQALLDIWDHTAGWWLDKGRMLNSELLRPAAASDYALINNARWDDVKPAADAFRHPSYWEFVLANIDAQKATAMPSLYRVVG